MQQKDIPAKVNMKYGSSWPGGVWTEANQIGTVLTMNILQCKDTEIEREIQENLTSDILTDHPEYDEKYKEYVPRTLRQSEESIPSHLNEFTV